MVERHFQHPLDTEIHLAGPREQMADVFRIGADHLRAEKYTGSAVGIHLQHALIAQHDAGTALALERYLADDGSCGLRRREPTADDANLRVGEHHAQQRPPKAAPERGKPRGVVAGYASF